MSSHVALLRGVNVGGRNRLPMKDLVQLVEATGAKEVRTYIQSGNVIFQATAALAKKLPAALQKAIRERFGFESPVILRTAAELQRIVKANPFLADGAEDRELSVAFLAAAPTAARVKRLDPERSPGDEFVVRGKDIFLRFPNGIARTKLTSSYLDSTLATISTARNWKTTCKLVELVTS